MKCFLVIILHIGMFFRQRIDKILDQSIDKGDEPEVRGLSSELPAAKVAQLRTLVKKNLKNKPLDDERSECLI